MTEAPSEAQRIKDAFAEVRRMRHGEAPLDVQRARELESTLRPVAQLPEMQREVVPLLDRLELWSLAMAWDSEPRNDDADWLLMRMQRWLHLGAPELAIILLLQMQREGHAIEEPKALVLGALEEERASRRPLYRQNLDAMAEADPEMADEVAQAQRLAVGLKPVGSGVGEVGPTGWPSIEVFAPGDDMAREQAAQALDELDREAVPVVMGTGDAALLMEASLRMATQDASRPVPARLHVVEPRLPRVRALLELGDLHEPLRSGRIRLHSGSRLQQPLADVLDVQADASISLLATDPEVLALFR